MGPTKRQLYCAISPEQISDFLAHAEGFHKANMKMEAAVLASAVLEDTMKKIAVKNGTLAHGSLEQIIEGLAKADIINPVRKRHLEAYTATRNRAFHGPPWGGRSDWSARRFSWFAPPRERLNTWVSFPL